MRNWKEVVWLLPACPRLRACHDFEVLFEPLLVRGEPCAPPREENDLRPLLVRHPLHHLPEVLDVRRAIIVPLAVPPLALHGGLGLEELQVDLDLSADLVPEVGPFEQSQYLVGDHRREPPQHRLPVLVELLCPEPGESLNVLAARGPGDGDVPPSGYQLNDLPVRKAAFKLDGLHPRIKLLLVHLLRGLRHEGHHLPHPRVDVDDILQRNLL
mmetsp:Transcript_15056/g.20948  ORF Transcript_15056/g.20948 Transcript_15056/m.20948 type:complete len:213 (-) Transcript_15056:544-1182(-)